MFSAIRRSLAQFIADDCLSLAAALAYYTLFAMPPLLFLLVTIVSWGMSAAYEQELASERAQRFLQQQAANLIGNEAAGQEIGSIIRNSQQQSGAGWKSLLSLVGVLVGATGLVGALQAALNRVWRVKPAEGRLAARFLMKRLLSLALILAFGFLLLVSFVVSTVLNALTDYAAQQLGISGQGPLVVNQIVSFLTTGIFFMALFRLMPDANVSWREATLGGLFTVVLFSLGRLALYYYWSSGTPGAQLGSAAGSLVVILIWVYYSSIILLFGAEFTANLSEQPAQPEPGAVRVVEHVEA